MEFPTYYIKKVILLDGSEVHPAEYQESITMTPTYGKSGLGIFEQAVIHNNKEYKPGEFILPITSILFIQRWFK